MHMNYLPFCVLLIPLVLGCGAKGTGPKIVSNDDEAVVKLLKQKLAAANGAVPPFWQEKHKEQLSGGAEYRPMILLWEDEDLTIDVRKSDSVVSPYTGTAALSGCNELSWYMLQHDGKSQVKRITFESLIEDVVQNPEKYGLDLGSNPKEAIKEIMAEERQSFKGQALKFYYEYTDSKWKLVKCETPEGGTMKPVPSLSMFPQFQ